MDQMLEGIKGAFTIMDDILIAGKDIEEHDRILKQVIKVATTYNLRLNFDKCQIRKTSVPYVGHLITAEGLRPDPGKTKAITAMHRPEDKDALRPISWYNNISEQIHTKSEPGRCTIERVVENWCRI